MALNIAAVSYVSLSEIQTIMDWVTEEFADENPDIFNKMLYDLGMDVYNYPSEKQVVTHRNRFNNVITCPRYVGNERQDRAWIESGHASVEAVDKSKNNRLLVDLYRQKGLVESV